MNAYKYENRLQFLARFGYDGSKFFGVQEQPRLPTVLGALRNRIKILTNQSPRALIATARTDRGVHAQENLATFYLKKPLDINKFIFDIQQSNLQDGLSNINLYSVSPHVHARGNSLSKIYVYKIKDACEYNNLNNLENYWSIAPKLDLISMQRAAEKLIGIHDFSSFRGGGCSAGSPIKKIIALKIWREDNLINIQIHGDGFLRKMVRNIVGILVEIGSGLRNFCEIKNILESRSRESAGITVPAYGLTLVKINFKNKF